jgi:hypothetical protein
VRRSAACKRNAVPIEQPQHDGASGIDNVDDLPAVESVDVFFIVLYRPGRSN